MTVVRNYYIQIFSKIQYQFHFHNNYNEIIENIRCAFAPLIDFSAWHLKFLSWIFKLTEVLVRKAFQNYVKKFFWKIRRHLQELCQNSHELWQNEPGISISKFWWGWDCSFGLLSTDVILLVLFSRLFRILEFKFH